MRLIAFSVSLFLFFSCGKKRESIHPEYKDMMEAVYSSLTIQPDDEYRVNASIGGYLDQVLVKEGDFVKKGDLMFTISNKPIQLNQENAKLAMDLMRENYSGQANILEEMKLSLRSAQIKMSNDSVNFNRFVDLDKKNACSKVELDNARLAYQVSKNSYLALKTQLDRKQQELKNQLNQSKNNLDASASKTDDYYIKSNINGKVFQVNKEKGELVSLQEPIAILGDGSKFTIEMLIDEVDISEVELGQKVLVTLEAYGDKVFEANVTEIAPKMDEKTQTFKLKARFTKAPKKLYMGLSGEGNIVVREGVKALVIPADYLMPGNLVETDKGKIKVKVGLVNWDYVQILSGVDKNTLIYKPE